MANTSSLIAETQSVSREVYDRAVGNAALVPHDFLVSQSARVERAYVAGEPVWMLADELRLRFQMRAASPKSARDLAVRVIRF